MSRRINQELVFQKEKIILSEITLGEEKIAGL
jgi:hypothetical protein